MTVTRMQAAFLLQEGFLFSTVKGSLKGISDAYDTIYPIAFKLQLTARDETVLSLHSELMPECPALYT